MKHSLTKLPRFTGMLVFLGIILAACFGYPFSGCSYLKIAYLRLVCPLGFLETSLATHTIIWQLVPGFLIVCGLLFLLGRSYCAWICPASYSGKKTASLLRSLLPEKLGSGVATRWARTRKKLSRKYALGYRDGMALLAGGMLGIFIFGFPAFCLFCPIGVISRNLISLATHYHFRHDLVLLTIPVFTGLVFGSGWKCCCPVGTVRGLISGTNRTLIPVLHKERCTRCGKCAAVCPAGQRPFTCLINPGQCSKCLACVDICPEKALEVSVFKRNKIG